MRVAEGPDLRARSVDEFVGQRIADGAADSTSIRAPVGPFGGTAFDRQANDEDQQQYIRRVAHAFLPYLASEQIR